MNKLLVGILLCSTVTSALAEDFRCKDIYETKMEKMEKTYKVRKATRIALPVVALGAATALTFGSAVGVYGVAVVSSFGLPISQGIYEPTRDDKIKMAYEAQSFMTYSHDEMLDLTERERQESIKALIKQVDELIRNPHILSTVIYKINQRRAAANLPPLPSEQAVEAYKSELIKEIMDQELQVNNAISFSLDYLKSKKLVSKNTSYDEIAIELERSQEKFCENGKARTLKKSLKKIFK